MKDRTDRERCLSATRIKERKKIHTMNINSIFNMTFSNDFAIDPGTSRTRIYMRGRGIILNEPTLLCVDERTGAVVAFGKEAARMDGKTPKGIKMVRPIRNGVVADHDMTVILLKKFFEKAAKKSFLKPRAVVSIPAGATAIEKRALSEAVKETGMREVFVIEEPIAAAAGAGCDASLARGMLICDLGAGRCDVSSISLGRSVISRSISYAGDSQAEDIIKYVKKAHELNIGMPTAETIKAEIGTAAGREVAAAIKVYGTDAKSGRPKTAAINSDEIKEAITPMLDRAAELIKGVLEDTPSALQGDILEDGMLITGGGAKLMGIERYLRDKVGIRVYLAKNVEMDECVIHGAGAELDKLDERISPEKRYAVLASERE